MSTFAVKKAHRREIPCEQNYSSMSVLKYRIKSGGCHIITIPFLIIPFPYNTY